MSTTIDATELKTVPAAAPKLGYLAHQAELDQAYHEAMDSGWYILGKGVQDFEAQFAAYVGTSHAIGVATGTDAITLALVAAGIGEGDEVITTPLTAAFTAMGIMRAGAKPVFVDVEETSYGLDPNKLKGALGPQTKAILPVHLYGQPADLDGIRQVLKAADREDVLLIEDACQAHGAFYGERRVGSIGLAGAFSFYPTKNLGGFGDGGMITTNDTDLAAKLQMLRDGGQASKYHHELYGFNSRLDELQARLLAVRLRYLDALNARRAEIAARYTEGLKPFGFLGLPQVADGRSHVWHLYVIKTEYRNALAEHLKAHGVGTGVHYPLPVSKQRFIVDQYGEQPSFPVTEALTGQILSLPMYPELTDDQVTQVIDAVRTFATV